LVVNTSTPDYSKKNVSNAHRIGACDGHALSYATYMYALLRREGLAERAAVFASLNFWDDQSHHKAIDATRTQTHTTARANKSHSHTKSNVELKMSNPTTQPPIPPEQRLALEQQARYNRMVRNLAIGGVVLCPVIMLLPPRKLDLYTFSLSVGFYLSADHLCTINTGRGLVQQFIPTRAIGAVTDLPTERAREMQKIIREEREKGRQAGVLSGEHGPSGGREEKGILGRIWMGDQPDDWKEKRMEEERKALEEGKGYMEMIFEQVWDVWNWDKKKGNDDEGKKD
jgi:uncharacterized protein YdaU (DUF1376 family)